MDSVHFYDNNFFLNDDQAREIAGQFAPLGLNWWVEARVDAVLRFSDDTWRKLRRAGLAMIFFGAESGSDEVLRQMNKGITTEQTLEVARRTRQHGIIPEFSFVFGNPDDAAREIDINLAFIRKLKQANPAMELITYFYTPTPQRRATYGNVDARAGIPDTLEEWAEPAWINWMTHVDPDLPWLDRRLKAKVEDFELVLKSRFPSVHDRATRRWGKVVGRALAKSNPGSEANIPRPSCCAISCGWPASSRPIDRLMAIFAPHRRQQNLERADAATGLSSLGSDL